VASAAATVARPDGGPTPSSVVRAVWPLLVARGLVAFGYGVDVVLLAVLATEQLRQGTAAYGWLLAAAGAGGLVAAAVLRRQDRGRTAGPVTLGLAMSTLPLLVFLLQPNLGGGLAVQVVRGAGAVLVTVAVLTALQRTIPSVVAGRVFGATHVVVLVGTSAGALVVPVLLDLVGLDATIVIVALVPLAVALVCVPALRRYDASQQGLMRSMDPTVDVLRRLTLFQDANRATLYLLAESASEVKVDPGAAIVVQGEESDALYVLVSGTVAVTAQTLEGPRHLRDMTAPGYLGEIGLLHGVPRTATVAATEPCVLWRIPAEVFLRAAAQSGLSSALTETVRLRFAGESLAGTGLPTAS
jgi:hypothetical protein